VFGVHNQRLCTTQQECFGLVRPLRSSLPPYISNRNILEYLYVLLISRLPSENTLRELRMSPAGARSRRTCWRVCRAGIVQKTLGIFGKNRRKIPLVWGRVGRSLGGSRQRCRRFPQHEEALPAPWRPRTRTAPPSAVRFPEVLDVHLTANFLTVSVNTVYTLVQRGDVPGRKVDRMWLTTTTAVLRWLEQSAAHDGRAGHRTRARHCPRRHGRVGGRGAHRHRASRDLPGLVGSAGFQVVTSRARATYAAWDGLVSTWSEQGGS
jgi:hypothetical protein